jgi:uncharacterized protein (DUF433 family)
LLYSFRDIIALRTFVYLREELPLQRIRKAVDNLRELGNTDHLSSYRLYSDGQSVLWSDDREDHGLVDLYKMPGQYVMKAVMRDILKPFKNRQGEQVVDLLMPRRHVRVDPDVKGGYPVILHTRIPYDLVGGLVADGMPVDDVAYFYPTVNAEAAKDAHDFFLYVERIRSHDLGAAAG